MTYDDKSKGTSGARIDALHIALSPFVFQTAAALKNTGILSELEKKKESGMTAEEIASARGLSLYGVEVLTDAGESINLVNKKEDRLFITETALCLLNDGLTRVHMDFTQDICYRGLFHLEEAVRSGRPAGLRVFGEWKTIYHALAGLPEKARESWFGYDHYFSDRAFEAALPHILKNNPKKLLDVGGNTGRFALFCAEKTDDLYITICDLPGQVKAAEAAVKAKGMEKRVTFHSMEILDDANGFPEGADAIWMSQFLDCFSEEQIVCILKKAAGAMGPDTELFILETCTDRQFFDISAFCLNMVSLYFTCMANGNSRFYPSGKMKGCVEKAGLKIIDDVDNISYSHTLFRCRKNDTV